MPDKRLWTVSETARQLSVSPRTVERWIAAGQLTTCKIGRLVRIPVAAVSAFIHRKTRRMIPLPTPLDAPSCAAQQLAEIIRFPCRQNRS